MSASLKVIASIVGVTGTLGGVVGATLWKTGALNSVTDEIFPPNSSVSIASEAKLGQIIQTHQTQPTQTQISAITEEGNCKVIDPLNENFFDRLALNREDYTIVSCRNTDLEESETDDFDRWIGLLPNDLFGSYMGLEVGKSFNLETRTETIQDSSDKDRKTTFKSNAFKNSPAIGKWSSRPVESMTDKSINIVNLVSTEHSGYDNIYLLFGQEI